MYLRSIPYHTGNSIVWAAEQTKRKMYLKYTWTVRKLTILGVWMDNILEYGITVNFFKSTDTYVGLNFYSELDKMGIV